MDTCCPLRYRECSKFNRLMSDSPAPSFTIASTVVDTTLVFARDAAQFRDVDIDSHYRRIRVVFQPNKERSDDQSFGSPHEEWGFDLTDHFFAFDRRNLYSDLCLPDVSYVLSGLSCAFLPARTENFCGPGSGSNARFLRTQLPTKSTYLQ